jgi:hypothetical protein
MPALIVCGSWLRMKYSKNIVAACDHARTRCNRAFLENLAGRARINGVLAASWSDDDYYVFDGERHVGPPTSDPVLVLARWNDR